LNRKWLLIFALLCFPLGSLAHASSIDYASSGSGKDVTVVGSPTAGSTWSVTDDLIAIGSQTGSELGTVNITSGKLTSCATGLCFTGGSVVIKSETGSMIFTGMFSTGTITQSGGQTFLNANLMNGGTTEIASKSGTYSSNTIVSSAVPEPDTLSMLGAGLVGLWWVGRQKLMTAR
jgi:hypothetical protein